MTALAIVTSLVVAAVSSAGSGMQFRIARWEAASGGDGRTYAIVVATNRWSWREAREFAQRVGGDLAPAPSADALAFLVSLASGDGAFDCAGPWIGGSRFGGNGWTWTDGTAVPAFGWEPGRPAQSALLDAALCLSGDDAASGTWFDALPGGESGARTRSAIMRWSAFADCDGDGAPDRLEIAVQPALDADGDGQLDRCTGTLPADLDRDGRVTGSDLGVLLAAFGGPGPVGDLDHDGTVSGADLGLLLAAWTG